MLLLDSRYEYLRMFTVLFHLHSTWCLFTNSPYI